MRIKEYNNFYQITFLPHVFPVNCYVYEEKSTLTVIDIGFHYFIKDIMSLSERLKKPVTSLIITHPHKDHIAGLDKFKNTFHKADIYISQRDSLLLKGDYNLFANEEKNKIKGGFVTLKTNPNYLVNDGDFIGSLKIISTPGHTPGSISLYDHTTKVLFVGDLLQMKGGLAVAGDTRWKFPFPALATWSKEKSIESVKKISKLEIEYLATGHGEILHNPINKINLAIKSAENKLKKI